MEIESLLHVFGDMKQHLKHLFNLFQVENFGSHGFTFWVFKHQHNTHFVSQLILAIHILFFCCCYFLFFFFFPLLSRWHYYWNLIVSWFLWICVYTRSFLYRKLKPTAIKNERIWYCFVFVLAIKETCVLVAQKRKKKKMKENHAHVSTKMNEKEHRVCENLSRSRLKAENFNDIFK